AKWPGGRALIAAVDANRVVGRRSAKSAAPFRIHVTVRTGIDEHFLIATGDHQRQCVRVAMAGASRTKRPGIEKGTHYAAAHDHDSANLKSAGMNLQRVALTSRTALRPKPPRCNLVRIRLRVREKALA